MVKRPTSEQPDDRTLVAVAEIISPLAAPSTRAGVVESTSPAETQIGRTMRAAHQAARCIPNTEIVKAGELVEARFARGSSPTTAARKVLALLIQAAAGDAWKPGPHSILKRDLRGSHESNDRLDRIFDELQRILLRVETKAPDGRSAALVAPVLAYRIEHLEDDDGSRVWWEFSEPARRAMQGSDYFAALNRGTVLAFESRYAVTLYERGCLLAGRRDPRWRGTPEELREVMGVPASRYRDWTNIRQKVIEPAVAEVNQIADFVASYRVDTGPRSKVVAIELWFRPKDPAARAAAAAELNRSRVGRKARRQGRVETVAPLMLPDAT
ncbi:MAG: replication initiation protein [Terracidiphilus sp.]